MKFNAPLYIPGGSYGICDRCGFKRRLNAMSAEWTGLRVCSECHDPRPPELDPPHVGPEGVPRPDARPEPPDSFVNDGAELREDGGTELREDGTWELRD